MRGYQLAHVTTIQAILSLVQNNHWKANEKHVIQSKKRRVWGEIMQWWKVDEYHTPFQEPAYTCHNFYRNKVLFCHIFLFQSITGPKFLVLESGRLSERGQSPTDHYLLQWPMQTTTTAYVCSNTVILHFTSQSFSKHVLSFLHNSINKKL